MNLSYEENLELGVFVKRLEGNPLIEMIYWIPDINGIAVITICNFNDSRNLINGVDKKKTIKSISDTISFFNIKNKVSRLKFYSDDISNYYNLDKQKKEYDVDNNESLEEKRMSLGNVVVLIDRNLDNRECKKRTRLQA